MITYKYFLLCFVGFVCWGITFDIVYSWAVLLDIDDLLIGVSCIITTVIAGIFILVAEQKSENTTGGSD